MFVYLAKVLKRTSPTEYEITVPELGGMQVKSSICAIKGLEIQYEVDETVFVVDLGHDFAIIGYLPTSGGAMSMKTDRIEAQNGKLGPKVTLGGVSGEDLAKMKYNMDQLFTKLTPTGGNS